MKGYNLSFVKPTRINNKLVANVTDDVLEAADPMWLECIVGYFVGKELPFKLVETALKHAWGDRLVEVRANELGFFFFHIPDADFRRKVLEGGPLTVVRVSLMLQQWKPSLELSKDQHSTIPVWVHLKNIPVALWSAPALRTEQMKLLSFARVCVEISALEEHVDSIEVLFNGNMRKVDVEYEWRPISCHKCGVFGHKCPKEANVMTGAPATLESSKAVWQTQPVAKRKPRKKIEDFSSPKSQACPTGPPLDNFCAELPHLSTSHSSDDGLEEGVDLVYCFDEDLLDDGGTELAQQASQVVLGSNLLEQKSRATPSPPSVALKTYSPKMSRGRFWNIRGLVDPVCQGEARKLVRSHNLCCLGILETKVSAGHFVDVSSKIIPGWHWNSNYDFSPRGRIWVGWDPSRVSFDIVLAHAQAIRGKITEPSFGISFDVSFIYGEHTFVARSSSRGNSPWLVAGDFDVIHDPSDRLGGSTAWISSFDELKNCLSQALLDDLRYVGYRYTWSCSSGINRKLRKIDRVLVNSKWCQDFSYSEASFLPPGISDHTPMIVRVTNPVARNKPFKFFNFWMEHPHFHAILT
ncbi:hypothetical protein BT93_G0923 [Corymbia citriodora subsp. variegata]|nr:hypothetical protein BT93_G0923 [Corymbia citriodora subsp. variegata]